MAAISEHPIIVAGSGRSGTTWLGNVIAGDDHRIIFEPFDYRRTPEFSGLTLRPYFRPNEKYPQWGSTIEKILRGEVSSDWVDQDLPRLNTSAPLRGLVIKEIRANGMLGWLQNNYSCKIVFLLRHPCAVVASRMSLGWDAGIDEVVTQGEFIEDYLTEYAEVIAGADTPAKRHAVMWCIENLVPLRQLPGTGCCTLYYEDLAAKTQSEVVRVLDFLELPLTESRKAAMQELSRTSRNGVIRSAGSLLGGWREQLSAEDLSGVGEIVKAFGIDVYATDSLLPVRKPL
ncbi:MAG: hypothetical protein CVU69_02630 [Deltaproteobacteria bacterium HGW-Deltaproteobacteria-4]|nr:MAG: hypothetical protein CVU69_02630 [Deltaproteobacteria bacterium HGW-Deltaproteobacteria-4]